MQPARINFRLTENFGEEIERQRKDSSGGSTEKLGIDHCFALLPYGF
jgi:hypothetical protein